jgi:hypothetical protein
MNMKMLLTKLPLFLILACLSFTAYAQEEDTDAKAIQIAVKTAESLDQALLPKARHEVTSKEITARIGWSPQTGGGVQVTVAIRCLAGSRKGLSTYVMDIANLFSDISSIRILPSSKCIE